MKRWMILLAVLAIGLSAFAATKQAAPAPSAAESASAPAPAAKAAGEKYWVEPMKKVHARFTGEKGAFAQFGDSITVTMAFWSPLVWSRKNMDEPTQAGAWRVARPPTIRRPFHLATETLHNGTQNLTPGAGADTRVPCVKRTAPRTSGKEIERCGTWRWRWRWWRRLC